MSAPAEIERWSPFKVWLFTLFNRNPKSNLAAVDRMTLGPGDRFLDLGCGAGAALEHALATGASVAGVDPSPSMVERVARRLPGVDVAVGSAEAIPFPDGAFTAVLTVSSYHHWADRSAGLAEILRILAPGGRLFVVEHKLRRAKGHGVDPKGADDLAAALLTHGYAASAISEMKAGWARFFVVTATAPE